jgi:hypothetical protein
MTKSSRKSTGYSIMAIVRRYNGNPNVATHGERAG